MVSIEKKNSTKNGLKMVIIIKQSNQLSLSLSDFPKPKKSFTPKDPKLGGVIKTEYLCIREGHSL